MVCLKEKYANNKKKQKESKCFIDIKILVYLLFFACFSFKQIMHGHIRDRKEISNDFKLLTLHFCYAEAYKCHFMIDGQQW